jgi:methionyl-tRNA formyltransferase
MRLVFAGTPAFAAAALGALAVAGHEIALVLTQPDRPAGRGLKLRQSEVKALALEHGFPIAQPATLKSADALQMLRASQASAMVVAAYGLILPQVVLDSFALGCINIHASLLPRWRGAAPIQRAILAGDTHTGISIMQMEAGLDTGPVLMSESIPIAADDTAATLHDKLAALGARCIVACLPPLERGERNGIAQPQVGVTYAGKIQKSEAVIDWSRSAQELDRQIRALNPFPVASTSLRGEAVRLWRGRPLPDLHGEPGTVIDASKDGIVVGTGNGAVCLLELQRASSRRLSASEFLRGCALQRGEQFGT